MKRNIKLTKNRLLIVGVVLSVLLGIDSYVYYTNPPIQNVFDQIYYDQYNAFSGGKSEKSKGSIMYRMHDLKSSRDMAGNVFQVYETDSLPPSISRLSYYFIFELKAERDIFPGFDISYTYKLNDGARFDGNFAYDPNTKVMKETFYIVFSDDLEYLKDIIDKEEIISYLKESGITLDEMRKVADEALYGVALTDWFAASPSNKFSLTNLGNVKIEKSELFQ